MIMGKTKEEQTSSGLHNAMAAGSFVKGNITSEADFRLDGRVEGDIACSGKIVVGQKGSVTGNIRCQNAEIHGEIIGTIQTDNHLTLKATARIQGDIRTQTLEIEAGAKFDGTCRMKGEGE